MPKPPQVDEFDQINFVVSSVLLGCTPPFTLMVQFAREPALDVFLVLVAPDMVDLIKRWLRPQAIRYRVPSRHGRKARWVDATVDVWETINTRVYRTTGGHYPGIKLPGARAAFAIGDVADRVNWTAFCLEGLTAIGFQGFLGALNYRKQRCEGLAYVSRQSEIWSAGGGAGDLHGHVPMPELLGAQGYVSTESAGLRTYEGPCNTAASAVIIGAGSEGLTNFSLAVRDFSTNAIIGQTGSVDLAAGESATLSVSADVAEGQAHYIGWNYDAGFFKIGPSSLLSWANPLW